MHPLGDPIDDCGCVSEFVGNWLSATEYMFVNKEGKRFILFDAPVLIEGHFDRLCDAVVCVLADKDTRIGRIMNRDGISLEEAARRIGVQQSDEFYISHADYIIHNDRGPEDARCHTHTVIDEILKKESEQIKKMKK